MNKSEDIKEIAKALVKFQSEVQKVSKSATNPFFKSSYAPLSEILEAIREPLAKNKLSFVQFPEGDYGLTTLLMHESGQWIESTYFMQPTKHSPQDAGSVITYQRRYALGAVLGLNIDEDDDGNKASKPQPKQAVKTTTKKKPSIDLVKAVELIDKALDIDKLKMVWSELPDDIKQNEVIQKKKETKKELLTK